MQRDDAYRIVQRLGQQAWDTQTPLRTLLEQENVEIDLDEVFDYGYYTRHVPTVLARLEVILIAVLIFGAPENSATLFHEMPAGIGDPFLYLENDGRRAATVSVLDAAKVSKHGIEIHRPVVARRDELVAAGLDRLGIEAEIALRAAAKLGITTRRRAARLPARSSRTICAPTGIELTVDDDEFVRAGA